ncbi:MAG: hypothetical protein E3J35_05395 [Methanomassiliicoccales archaeon]|nr:MAG: hypothetical protein E3J35_05395 [Methanomassiliicoccales archaeon]
MDEKPRAVDNSYSPDVRIVNLSLKRLELALKCRFQRSCLVRSKNCHTRTKRVGLSYSLRNHEDRLGGDWETLPNAGVGTHSPASISEFVHNPIRRG